MVCAAAREGGVGELLAQAGVGEQEGGVGGQALGDVAGERVAVLERGAALAGGVQEEAAVELDLPVVDADGEPLVVGVDVGDRAAVAVGDAVLVVVALDDDQVAGGEGAAGQLELRDLGGARRLAPCSSGELVELGDVGAAVSEHDRVLTACVALPPVLDQPGAGLLGGGGGVDAAVLLVGGDRLGGAAVGDVVERAAFPRFGLALVVDEFDGEPARDEGAEGAAGLDLGQLAVIADQHQLPVRAFDVLEQLGELPGGGHAGLVDHEHARRREWLCRCGGRGAARRCWSLRCRRPT